MRSRLPLDPQAARLLVLALAATLLFAACQAGASPSAPSTWAAPVTPSAVTIGPSSSPADGEVTVPGQTPTLGPTPTFDPGTISITLKPIATVEGAPLAFAAPTDGSRRMFVAAKDGRIWTLKDGAVATTPLVDLRGVVSTGGEQGLLGIAVHPSFPADPRVFVDYTDTNGNTLVASYRVSASDPDRLDPATEQRIIAIEQPYENHNGGAIAFGPDGMLYVSLGDGGSGGDPLGNGQRLDTLLAKALRLDVGDGSGAGYVVPAGNPFVNQRGARPEIWLTGLRNPWRMGFDRRTGDLWIGDVGQGDWEEVDVARAGVGGLNFGWNVLEGSHCYPPSSSCSASSFTPPVAEYDHSAGCTIIGGSVYRGIAQPLLEGAYLFADYCSGTLWAISANSDGPVDPVRVGTAGSGIAAFGEDAQGELFAANLDGTISGLVASRR